MIPVLDSVFWLCLLVVAYPFILYPLLVRVLAAGAPPLTRPPTLPKTIPKVSIIIAVHNGASLIVEKVRNTLLLSYPPELKELIVSCDGCTDETVALTRTFVGESVLVIEEKRHEGKNGALNRAVQKAGGDLLLFTDVDAMLPGDTLQVLVPWFTDKRIGGVGGSKRFELKGGALNDAQVSYNRYQQGIKDAESRLSSTGTVEGKLHVIRRELFRPIAGGAADDLFNLLSVVEQHHRFIADPKSYAIIPAPSVNRSHEVRRRRRIVRGSLAAQWEHRDLFNPLRYGWFSWILLSHKLGRRLVAPVLFMLFPLAFVRIALAPWPAPAQWLTVAVAAAAAAGALFELLRIPTPGVLRLCNKAWYFVLGNWATLLGVFDVARGKYESGAWSTSSERSAALVGEPPRCDIVAHSEIV